MIMALLWLLLLVLWIYIWTKLDATFPQIAGSRYKKAMKVSKDIDKLKDNMTKSNEVKLEEITRINEKLLDENTGLKDKLTKQTK